MLMFKKAEQGFTMIELLVAIAIFGIIIPTLTVGVNGLITINHRARNLTITNIVAENKIEELRSAGFNSLNVGTYTFTSELPAELSKPRSATYQITNPTAGINNITVTISYWDYNRTKTVVYKTVVSELGVGQ